MCVSLRGLLLLLGCFHTQLLHVGLVLLEFCWFLVRILRGFRAQSMIWRGFLDFKAFDLSWLNDIWISFRLLPWWYVGKRVLLGGNLRALWELILIFLQVEKLSPHVKVLNDDLLLCLYVIHLMNYSGYFSLGCRSWRRLLGLLLKHVMI